MAYSLKRCSIWALGPGRPGLYVITSAFLLLLLFVGFSRTFFLRPIFVERALPGYLVLHGVIQTAWPLGFLLQAIFVVRGQVGLHRRIAPAVITIGAAGCLSALYVSLRLLDNIREGIVMPDGSVESVTGGTIWNIALGGLFGLFLILAVALRRHAAMHKRFMLLALIASIVPAAAVRLPFSLEALALMGIPMALIGRNVAIRQWPHWVSITGATTFVAVFLLCVSVLGNLEWAQRFVLGSF